MGGGLGREGGCRLDDEGGCLDWVGILMMRMVVAMRMRSK
jgi:hypothetical protein